MRKSDIIRLRALNLVLERDSDFYRDKNNNCMFSDSHFVPLVRVAKVVSFVTPLPHLVLRMRNVTVLNLNNAHK